MPHRKLGVLIVDDKPEIVEAIASFLKIMPEFKNIIEVSIAYNAKRAMNIIQEKKIGLKDILINENFNHIHS